MHASRNAIVDAWRAVLILAVLCFHYLSRWDRPENLYGYDFNYSPLWGLGAVGPYIFFAISGLVITMTVQRSHTVFEFCFRRFSRLYPAAIVCSSLTFTIAWAIGPDEFKRSVNDLFLSYTLAPGPLGGQYVDGAYWSLWVELRFYIFVALAFALTKRMFWLVIAALALVGFAVYMGLNQRLGHFLLAPYASFFLCGMAAWYGLFEGNRKIAIFLVSVAIVASPASFPLLTLSSEPSLLTAAVAYGGVLLMFAMIASNARFPLGPLPYLGRISYSLYLLHQVIGVSVIAIIKRELGWPDMIAFAIATTIVIGLASATYHIVEMPVQKWLRRWHDARKPHWLGKPKAA